MKFSIRTILLLAISVVSVGSCSLLFSPNTSIEISDIQELLDLPIATPTDEDVNIVLEDPTKIIVYHGFACAESKKDGTEDILRLQGALKAFPDYVNRATIILNGWNSEYLSKDHHVAAMASGILNIEFSLRDRVLTWDAFGALSDNNFDDSYSWCYYYTVIAWNNNEIDAEIDHNDLGNIFLGLDNSPAEVNMINEMEVFQFDQDEPVAMLPRGYGVVKNRDDFHIIQNGYYMNYEDDLTSPIVKWDSSFIFKDDDADNDTFDVFEMVSAIGGTDIGVVKSPFTLKKWDDGSSGFTAVSANENEFVVEDLAFEYAIPLLTGWDLHFPQDEHLREIGIWIDNFEYEFTSDKVGTLTYNLSSQLRDKEGGPSYSMDHNVTILGIRGTRSKGVSPVTISAATDNVFVAPDRVIELDSDIRDGSPIDPSDFEWYSNVDGLLGNGKTIEVTLSGPRAECHPPYIKHEITVKSKSNPKLEVDPIILKVGKNCNK